MRGVALLLLPLMAACASHVTDDEAGNNPREDQRVWREAHLEPGSSPVLATMVTRDHRLEISRVEGNSTFTVANADGKVLAQDLELWELARDYPSLHRQYETAFAGEGVIIDASVDAGRGGFAADCDGCDYAVPKR